MMMATTNQYTQQDSKRTKELMEGFALPMINGVSEVICAGYDKRKQFTPSESKDSFRRWVFAGEL